LEFDWDRANIAHIAQHKVKPEETEQALKNDPVDLEYPFVEGEHRWTVIGHTNTLRILTVVWTLRGEATRVVTARESGKVARMAYLRHKGLFV
jgi:uncharacterized DUF497 family protein